MIDYIDIMKQVEVVKDKIFCIPLTEVEVWNLEKKVGITFPMYYREFLLHFGFQQDFVQGLFTSEDDFVEQNGYLTAHLSNYVLIGDNGGEDFWMVRTDNTDDLSLYNWEDDEVEKTDFTFKEMITYSLAQYHDEEIEFLSNADKSWCVQFAISTDHEEDLYNALPFVLLDNWTLVEKSEAGGEEYAINATLDNEPIRLQRLKFNDLSTPMYSFNYKEDVASVQTIGLIKKWTVALKAHFPEFNLIDYGILPTSLEMD